MDTSEDVTTDVTGDETSEPTPSFEPASNEMVQVVDYDEHFNAALNDFLATNGLTHLGFDYHVASILGAQSSGKSTLLNLLFGTQFCTMDASSGRYQVTQGVWLGLDPESRIIVLDLEGTDSRERGEDSVNFERKIALFALALSEVLIVNIWAQDVGRYNAANMDLLKTVMELDLQLFFGSSSNISASPSAASVASAASNPDEASQQSDAILSKQRMHKTRLLFVLRDHVTSPFETLCETLRTDVQAIWDTISKPDSAEGIPLTDFFDIDFFALPHKVLMAPQFEEKGAELRRRFKEEEVFSEDYRSGIAADGFSEYANAVWETIRANRELDIPTQKEMLAHVRCEQIAKDALDSFEEQVADVKADLLAEGATPVPGLLTTLITACDAATSAYRDDADRYSQRVADEKGADLATRLGNEAKTLLDAQISLSSDIAATSVHLSLSERDDASEPWVGWNETRDSLVADALSKFEQMCVGDALADLAEGHALAMAKGRVEAEKRRLDTRLLGDVARVDEDVRERGAEHCLSVFTNGMKAPIASVVDAASDDIWKRASEVTSTAWEAVEREAHTVYGSDGIGMNESEQTDAIEDDLKPRCFELAVKTIRTSIGSPNHLLMRMTKRFEDVFRFDERGVPRHFGPTEDIEALFVAARDQAESMIDVMSEVKLEGVLTQLRASVVKVRAFKDGGVDHNVLSAEAVTELREKLKRQAGAVFLEVKRAQEAARVTSKVPMWLMLVVLMLGWNEFKMVLQSPVLMFLLVLVAPVIYVAYVVDAPTLLGPAIGATLAPFVNQAKDMARQFLDSDNGGQAGVGAGMGSAGVGGNRTSLAGGGVTAAGGAGCDASSSTMVSDVTASPAFTPTKASAGLEESTSQN